MDSKYNFKTPAYLHQHSTYSFLDAIPSVKEWCYWAIENGVPGISITDHGNAISLHDIIKFPKFVEEYNKEKGTNYDKNCITGIPGIELYVKIKPEDKHHHHIIVWAISNEGYKNIIRLSSLAYNDTVNYFGDTKARVCLKDIKQHSEGLAISTACIASPMGKAIMDGFPKKAEELYKAYIDIFGKDNVYVEFHASDLTHEYDRKTQTHKPIFILNFPCGNYYKKYNLFLWNMVKKYGGKPVPATDAHFINKEDKIIQDVMLKNGSDTGWTFFYSYHQISVDEQYEKIKNHLGDLLTPEIFSTWIENTLEVCEKAKNINISYTYSLPEMEIPKHIQNKTEDKNKQLYLLLLEKISEHGRWNNSEQYVERFKYEMEVIANNGIINFIPYFLIYEDLCKYAKSIGIAQGPARGSAGASLVSYYLGIIHIDPIKLDLPFERFLSIGRIKGGSYPDIDSDFQNRKPIVEYLKNKYGSGFAQISTFTRMKTKYAIKDTMSALYGIPRTAPDIDYVCKTIPDSPQGVDEYDFLYGYTDSEDVYHKGHIEENEVLQNFFKKYPQVKIIIDKMIGSVRGWSRHASAFIVSTKNLSDGIIPMMKMEDKDLGLVPVTQYSAPMVEKSGLIKLDILVIKTMEAVSGCIKLIKDRHGIDFMQQDERGIEKIYNLPEDKAVYEDFYKQNTDSSFQFNTNLIKGYLPDFKPQNKSDLAILTSICRPGALDAKIKLKDGTELSATQYYIDVKTGRKQLEFLHSDLEPIIGKTNGIFCLGKGTQIQTEKCIKNIENIVPGDKVLTEDGTYQKVLALHKNGIKDVQRITFHNGIRLYCTPNHKLYDLTRGWIEANDISHKRRPKNIEKAVKKNYHIKSFWMNDGNTYEIGTIKDWLYGVIYHRGYIEFDEIIIDCRDISFANNIKNLINKMYGENSCRILYREKRKSNKVIIDGNLHTQPNLLLKEISEKFELIKDNLSGVVRGKSGRQINFVNRQVYRIKTPSKFTLNMITGMAESNNFMYYCRINKLSEEVALKIFYTLQYFQIESSCYDNILRAGKFRKPFIICYKDFYGKMPFVFTKPKLQKTYYQVRCPWMLDHIRDNHGLWALVSSKKENAGSMEVYDLSVENNHSYVANGVVVHNCYQEDVMKFLRDIALYTMEEADQIRSAISKKKHEVILSAFDRIRAATKSRGWETEQTEAICQQIEAFAKYSFNKSHGFGYSYIGYITMYLKHHYPLEWWTSVLNSHTTDEDKIREFVPNIKDKIIYPTVKNPYGVFTIVGNKIAAPLNMIKGVGEKALYDIIKKGPYSSLEDFADKIDTRIVNIGTICALIRGGALDCFADPSISRENLRNSVLETYMSILEKKGKSIKKDSKNLIKVAQEKTVKDMFLDDKMYNKVFCHGVVEYPGMLDSIKQNSKLNIKDCSTSNNIKGSIDIPIMVGNAMGLTSIEDALKFREIHKNEEILLFLVYTGYKLKEGISKRTGKPWKNLTIFTLDGATKANIVVWDETKAPTWTVGSIIYVRGTVEKNQYGITITPSEMDEL